MTHGILWGGSWCSLQSENESWNEFNEESVLFLPRCDWMAQSRAAFQRTTKFWLVSYACRVWRNLGRKDSWPWVLHLLILCGKPKQPIFGTWAALNELSTFAFSFHLLIFSLGDLISKSWGLELESRPLSASVKLQLRSTATAIARNASPNAIRSTQRRHIGFRTRLLAGFKCIWKACKYM